MPECFLPTLLTQLADAPLGEPPTVRDRVASWLTMQLGRCTDDAFAQRFIEACPSEGATLDDYRQRVIDVEGISALIGIRMRGGSTREPFVDVVATSAPLDAAMGPRVADAALRELAVFAPRRIRVRGLVATPDWPGWRAAVDQWFVAAPLSTVARATHGGAVRLQPIPAASNDEATAFVADGYAAWAERESWFADAVQPITAAGLRACQDANTAWWITADDQHVGLLALHPETDRELHGFCVHEELVPPTHAGRGHAASAQRLAARALIDAGHDPAALIFGMIDAANTPSLRTAARAGRPPVAAYHWLTPAPAAHT